MSKKQKILVALLLFLQILIVQLLPFFPEAVETIYSNGLYLFTSNSLRLVFGWLPFSFGDLFYTFIVLAGLRWLFLNRKRLIKDTKNWIIDVLATLSLVYFAFHIFWGFNYYRLPIHKKINIKNTYTTEALLEVTKQLITKVNTLQLELGVNDSSKVEFPYSKDVLLEKIPLGYQALSKTYPHLAYNTVSVKTSMYSLPLTYQGFSGYLNPISNEAQIDGLIPIFKYATTASHEIAHQLGYAAENEANFIGCLATIHHDDRYINYAGYAFALRHCLSDLYRRAPESYKEVLTLVNTGTLKNYQEVREFWESYQNPLEPFFKSTYNGFLKANQQKGGIKSYSYAVALLVNYFEAYPIPKS
jgi:hypothetical protein